MPALPHAQCLGYVLQASSCPGTVQLRQSHGLLRAGTDHCQEQIAHFILSRYKALGADHREIRHEDPKH